MSLYLVPVEKGRRIALDKAVIFVGRHPECDVVLDRSRKVSRHHCCFAHVNDKLMIRDLGSMNGVRVNGERVEKETEIDVGDEVMIGDIQYVLKEKPSPSRREKPKQKPSAKFQDDQSSDEDSVSSKIRPDFGRIKPVPIADDDELNALPMIEDEGFLPDGSEDDLLPLEDSGEY